MTEKDMTDRDLLRALEVINMRSATLRSPQSRANDREKAEAYRLEILRRMATRGWMGEGDARG